jgi:hypothetical protein
VREVFGWSTSTQVATPPETEMDDDGFFFVEATLETRRTLSTAVYVENAESVLHDTKRKNEPKSKLTCISSSPSS